MIGLIRSRLGNEEGFTLVELMVVVLIIAILVAIAIPTFLGARTSAQDRAALTAEKVFYVDNEVYTDNAGGELALIEPSIDWGAVTVTLNAADDQDVCLELASASGTVFALQDVASGANGGTPGTFYATGTCAAGVFQPTADLGW